ncbi:MAG: FAD-dependent oxidoreductase [Coriobacteriales bacterium]|jgi:electron transfer flavoprotein-quinone oxidoreductase|nr:FAD-dependent oxidoreductase [Coriobacteriales bacterium]
MIETDFDVIVVGAGCAGCVAAYELAKAEKSVLVVERGNYAGAKNMTGGRIYTHSLRKVFPDFENEAPLERKIAHERLSFIAPSSNMTIDFSSAEMQDPKQDSYSVLRGPFDQWLASKAEDAGAEFIYGIAIEDLYEEDGAICGVVAGEDTITAKIVILADGANSLLTPKAVGAKVPLAHQMAVGIKQTIELPSKVIEDRALCNPGEGAAWLFVGDATYGHVGGGFVYTNKESISIGLVATLSDLATSSKPIYQMLEDFKKHPTVAPLIRDGKLVEHSGHMVPEAGLNMMPPLYGNGVLLAGESAMMCMNLGYQVRGMDFAVSAGQAAAATAVKAIESEDVSAQSLSDYKSRLEQSYVLKDLQTFKGFPHYMENTTRLFNEYPLLAADVLNALFIVDGTPQAPVRKRLPKYLKGVGYGKLFKDLRGGLKAL